MDNAFRTHFDSLYPADSRFNEVEKILNFIKEGKSAQLISLPGVGRSNLMGFLAYNHKLKEKHLGDNLKWFHFVYLNFSEVKNRSLFDVNKFIFLSLIDSLKDRQMTDEHDKLHRVFKDHLELNDEIVLFQGLKEAMDFLTIEKELTVVFLFDQFESYLPQVTVNFFENLRILRNRAKYRFSNIFSLTRPLESLIEDSDLQPFSDFVRENHVFLTLADPPGLKFRLEYLEKITGKKVPAKIVDLIISLTGGHGKLTKLSEEIALSENITSIEKSDLEKLLLSKKIIRDSLLEILNSLTPFEKDSLSKKQDNELLERLGLLKKEGILIPLLISFNHEVPAKIDEKFYFDESIGEIKKGDQIVSDKLTAMEFKLLKYLMENEDRLITKDEIIKTVWSETSSTAGVTDQAVDQLISRLRKKIEKDANAPKHIETVKGRGIKFLP